MKETEIKAKFKLVNNQPLKLSLNLAESNRIYNSKFNFKTDLLKRHHKYNKFS